MDLNKGIFAILSYWSRFPWARVLHSVPHLNEISVIYVVQRIIINSQYAMQYALRTNRVIQYAV